MKVQIAQSGEETIRLQLVQDGNQVFVQEAGDGFSLVRFKINKDKLVMSRDSSVEHDYISVDSKGRIVEVPE